MKQRPASSCSPQGTPWRSRRGQSRPVRLDDSQCEEDSCSLRHIPVELDAAVDDEDKGCEEDQHDEDLAGVQIAEGVEVRSIAELAGLVELVHGAEFGMFLDLQCVADEVDVRDNIEHSKADKAVSHAGIQRQTGDFLSHDGGVDVQRASGEADRAAQQDDGCTGDGVQTHRKGIMTMMGAKAMNRLTPCVVQMSRTPASGWAGTDRRGWRRPSPSWPPRRGVRRSWSGCGKHRLRT